MQLVDKLMDSQKKVARLNSPCAFRLADKKDALQVVAVYEQVFGPGGIKAPGHEAYPAPEMFSVEGVHRVLDDSLRWLIVAELGQKIVGGMMVNFLSTYNCEFACVAVDPAYQGLGISLLMLSYARQLADVSSLTINATEIVTHSVLSQTAHNRAGFGKVIGFGYCQYPRVFFAQHPESCLWVGEIQGRVAQALRQEKPGGAFKSAPDEQSLVLNQEEQELWQLLRKTREVFVPPIYEPLVSQILAQFQDVLDYRIVSCSSLPEAEETSCIRDEKAKKAKKNLQIDFAGEEPYCYLNLAAEMEAGWQDDIDAAWQSINQAGKRFIQARIPANSPGAIACGNYLRSRGFAFLGLLPLYKFCTGPQGMQFDDLLVMQWIKPEIVAGSPLPGETNSVIKLYGYPANLSGQLLKVIRYDLHNKLG